MSYKILPFTHKSFDNKTVLVSGMAGDFLFLDKNVFEDFINHKLSPENDNYKDLKSKNLLADSKEELIRSVDMTATRYRSKKAFLKDFTSLHMMVITVRCNQKCKYCQVSCEEEDAKQYDMSTETASKIVDFILNSPSQSIKIEFQGGEPLINWDTIKHTVLYAKEKNKIYNKNLEFVICTNLTSNIKNKVSFIKEHNIAISTSLDGDKEVHDYCRVRKDDTGTYDKFIENLSMVREECGIDSVGALMTTTAFSLDKIERIIDSYIENKFDGIFLRALNPYGFADENVDMLGYKEEEFVYMYKRALDYIIKINKEGIFFPEHYTSLLLRRILTPFATGFVDLQSPSGAGISGVIYDYNGDVYPADEGRMLNRMGDNHFCMGNVGRNTYKEIFSGEVLREIVSKSCLEVMPICSNCVFSPYCGADPIRNYLETKDIIGYRINSGFCKKNKAIFNHLFKLIKENDEEIMDILWSWITRKPVRKKLK